MPCLVVVSRHVFLDWEAGRSYSCSGFERHWLPLLGKRQFVGSIAQSDSQDQVTNTEVTTAPELDTPATPSSTTLSATASSNSSRNSSRVLPIVLPSVFAIMAVTGALFFLRSKCKTRQSKSSESSKAIKPKTRKHFQPEKKASYSSRVRNWKSDKENQLFGDVNRQKGNASPTAPAASSINKSSSSGREAKSTPINSETRHPTPVKAKEISHPAEPTSSSSGRSALATAAKDRCNASRKNVSPMTPATTSPGPHPSQESVKASKRTVANSTSSHVVTSSSPHAEKSTQLEPSTLTPTKSPSFWKRLSQPRSSKAKKPRGDDAKTTPRSSSDPELHIHNPTLGTSQSAPDLASVPQISLDASQAPEPQFRGANVGGLAGIGVRDRNSIASFALSSSNGEVPTHKPNARSLSNYSPATSSPLSSQADCEEEIIPTAGPSSARPQSHQSRLSYQSSTTRSSRPRPGGNRSRLSYQQNRLSFIPDGTVTGSEDLLRMLRGPSPYPDEARPRSITSYSAPNSRPASRFGRVNDEV